MTRRAHAFGIPWSLEVPDRWSVEHLGRVAQIVNGFPFDSERFSSIDGTPLIRIRDLLAGETRTQYTGPEVSEAVVDDKDILVGMDGNFNAVWWQGGRSLLNQRLCCIRPGPRLDRRYLFYLLGQPLKVMNDLTWFTTVKHLLSTDLARLEIPLPPIEEQRTIADHLDRETAEIDEVVIHKARLIGLLSERRGSLADAVILHGMTPAPEAETGIAWWPTAPADWEVRRLSTTVTDCRNGFWGDDPTGGLDDIACVRVADFDRERSVVRDTELTMREIEPDHRTRHQLQRGDLLLEKSGGGEQQPVGKVVLFDRDGDAVCSNFIARMPVAPGHDPSYLRHLHAILYRRRINVRAIKQSTGIQNLDSDAYLAERVAVPPLAEQTNLARELDDRLAMSLRLTASIREQLDVIRERRAALISAAVTGHLR